jgi:hypothetical protein
LQLKINYSTRNRQTTVPVTGAGQEAKGDSAQAALFTLAQVLHISMVPAHGGNLTEKEKPRGSKKEQEDQ